MVEIAVADDAPIRSRHGYVHAADRLVRLHVFYPAVGGGRDVDPARHMAVVAGVSSALQRHALDAGEAYDRLLYPRTLSLVRARRLKREVERRIQGHRARRSIDGCDLDALAHRAFVDALEVLAVAFVDRRIVDLVEEREIAGRKMAGVRSHVDDA